MPMLALRMMSCGGLSHEISSTTASHFDMLYVWLTRFFRLSLIKNSRLFASQDNDKISKAIFCRLPATRLGSLIHFFHEALCVFFFCKISVHAFDVDDWICELCHLPLANLFSLAYGFRCLQARGMKKSDQVCFGSKMLVRRMDLTKKFPYQFSCHPSRALFLNFPS